MIEYETNRDLIIFLCKFFGAVIIAGFILFGLILPALSGNFEGVWSVWLGLQHQEIATVSTNSYPAMNDCSGANDPQSCYQMARIANGLNHSQILHGMRGDFMVETDNQTWINTIGVDGHIINTIHNLNSTTYPRAYKMIIERTLND